MSLVGRTTRKVGHMTKRYDVVTAVLNLSFEGFVERYMTVVGTKGERIGTVMVRWYSDYSDDDIRRGVTTCTVVLTEKPLIHARHRSEAYPAVVLRGTVACSADHQFSLITGQRRALRRALGAIEKADHPLAITSIRFAVLAAFNEENGG